MQPKKHYPTWKELNQFDEWHRLYRMNKKMYNYFMYDASDEDLDETKAIIHKHEMNKYKELLEEYEQWCIKGDDYV